MEGEYGQWYAGVELANRLTRDLEGNSSYSVADLSDYARYPKGNTADPTDGLAPTRYDYASHAKTPAGQTGSDICGL